MPDARPRCLFALVPSVHDSGLWRSGQSIWLPSFFAYERGSPRASRYCIPTWSSPGFDTCSLGSTASRKLSPSMSVTRRRSCVTLGASPAQCMQVCQSGLTGMTRSIDRERMSYFHLLTASCEMRQDTQISRSDCWSGGASRLQFRVHKGVYR
jgi:hypothetical protein